MMQMHKQKHKPKLTGLLQQFNGKETKTLQKQVFLKRTQSVEIEKQELLLLEKKKLHILNQKLTMVQ